MTSFLEVIAADDTQQRTAARKAVVLAKTRVDNEYGKFIRQQGPEALDYLSTQIEATVRIASAEMGDENPEAVLESIRQSYRDYFERVWAESSTEKIASTVHEARLPKMCPFHKDVTNISLQSGDPAAGFSALQSQWGGDRHCEGAGYKGDKCKFKPQMTTQSYWDERAEKLEQKRKERAERAEAEIPISEPESDFEPTELESPTEEVTDEPGDDGAADNVVHVDFGGPEIEGDTVGPAPEAEVPMSMAASAKTADGGPIPKMDKRKWTPQTVQKLDVDDSDGPHPTRTKDITDAIRADNNSSPGEIGEQVTERQDVSKDTNPSDQGAHTQTWTEGPKTAISAADPHKNELVELVQNGFDGFLPIAETQQAVLAHRNR